MDVILRPKWPCRRPLEQAPTRRLSVAGRVETSLAAARNTMSYAMACRWRIARGLTRCVGLFH